MSDILWVGFFFKTKALKPFYLFHICTEFKQSLADFLFNTSFMTIAQKIF